jgi:tripartite-type tricarboxylate transporter receptor subunit TctC
MVSLATRAGLQMTHIPFKGNGPATTAVVGGEVDILFGALPPLLPHLPTGRVRAIAVSSAKRSISLPDVPTVAESGYPGFDVTLWLGFFAPKGTPPAVMKRLETELVAVAQSADVKEQMTRQGLEAHSLPAAQLAKLLKAEIANYQASFKVAGIKLQ